VKCTQTDCDEVALTTCMWVDGKWIYSCARHTKALQGVMQALGMSLQINILDLAAEAEKLLLNEPEPEES
jgi:hypothetical protein